MIAPIIGGEPILRHERRDISILVASEEVTITRARYAAGEQVAAPHVHHGHTDAFYVLEGELTFEIGREAKTITVTSGGFVAAPPGVAHSLRNDSDRPARWLTIHAARGLRLIHARHPRGCRGRMGHLSHASGRRPAGKRCDRPTVGRRAEAMSSSVCSGARIARVWCIVFRP